MIGVDRTLIVCCLVVAVLLSIGLASWHEKHYARRQLMLLSNRVEGIERLLVEDRSI